MTETPPGWRSRRVGELGRYVNGMAFKPTDWTEAGLPIVRIQNLTDSSKPCNRYDGPYKEKYLIDDGDLLISWSASLGAFIWQRGPALLNQHIFRVEVNKNLVTRDFLYFTVLNALGRMKEMTHGSTMRHITKKKFEAMEVPVPELDEQDRIVRRVRAALARAQEVRRLRTEVRAAIAAIPNAIRHGAWNQLGLDHEIRPLKEVAVSTKNGLYKPKRYHGEGVGLVRMYNIRDGRFLPEPMARLQVSADEASKYSLASGDVVVSRVNSAALVGKSALIASPSESLVFEAMIIRLRLNTDVVNPSFAVQMMNSPEFLHDLRSRAKHAIGQSSINQGDLLSSKIPVPPLPVQDALVAEWDEGFDVAKRLAMHADSEAMEEALPGAILRKALSGEL